MQVFCLYKYNVFMYIYQKALIHRWWLARQPEFPTLIHIGTGKKEIFYNVWHTYASQSINRRLNRVDTIHLCTYFVQAFICFVHTVGIYTIYNIVYMMQNFNIKRSVHSTDRIVPALAEHICKRIVHAILQMVCPVLCTLPWMIYLYHGYCIHCVQRSDGVCVHYTGVFIFTWPSAACRIDLFIMHTYFCHMKFRVLVLVQHRSIRMSI